MLVGAFGASSFGLHGGIPMEAAQTRLYRAPASRADITQSIQIPINHSLTKKRGVSMPPSKVWERTRLSRASYASFTFWSMCP